VRYSAGAPPDRAVRRIVLFVGVVIGAVTVALGVLGLLAPIWVSSPEKVVGCRSAVAHDLSAARAEDERSGSGKPVVDAAAPD
jgi:hypothetical protein